MKTIKIFLASSNDLQEERDAIELLVSRENKKYAVRGIQFEIVRWEQLLQSFQPKRIQDFFNEKMLECHSLIALFYNRFGDFTLEEFQTAYKSFKKGNNPRHIFVFFKSALISNVQINEQIIQVNKLKKSIERHKQIYCTYENLDQLKFKIKEQMDLILETCHKSTPVSEEMPADISESKTIEQPFYRKWMFWFIAILLCGLLSGGIYHSIPYNFSIPNKCLRSDAVVVIQSENWKANQNKFLNVEFDGFKFPKSGKPTKKDQWGNQIWQFKISDLNPPEICEKDGVHKLRLGFSGKGYSKECYQVYFDTKPLIVDATLLDMKDSNTRVLKGVAATESQLKENTISVDVIFYHEGPTTVYNIPVKCVDDPNTQLVYYEFETAFQGFPEISEDDPRYKQPFFELNITDKAGNKYVQEQSYAQFVAAGALRIAAGNANIRLNKFHPEGSDDLAAHLTYMPENQSNKPPNLQLKVRSIAKDIRTLEWTADNIQQSTPHTLIFRNDKRLAKTAANKYTDTEVLDSETVSYKVVQEDSSGRTYTSNVEKVAVIMDKTFILTVRSNVFNDMVFIDNKKYGSTRLDIPLTEGSYALRVVKEGWFSFEKNIDLKENTTVHAQLKQKPGSLEVVTIPYGAAIYVNKTMKGISPINIQAVSPGVVYIKASLEGYAEQTKNINLKPEQHIVVEFDLSILQGIY
jgi:hypothetical protein